jgi:hypothetical protein
MCPDETVNVKRLRYLMRKILILALAAPLFAACTPDRGSTVSRPTGTAGDPGQELRAAQPGDGRNAGGGVATITGTMYDGRPTIERR